MGSITVQLEWSCEGCGKEVKLGIQDGWLVALSEHQHQIAANHRHNGDAGKVAPIRLFSAVVALYLQEKALDNVKKTLLDKAAEYKKLIERFGDLPMNAVNDDMALIYKQELIERKITAQTINRRLSFLKDLFDYAVNNKLYRFENPFEHIRISKKSKLAENVEHYQSFNKYELGRIFELKSYVDYAISPDYYFLPLLALYTGARIEELASLGVADIKKDDNDIYYFDIKKSKNKNSRRKIPTHSAILNSSFMKYVSIQKDKSHTKVFHFLINGKNGFSKNGSRQFGFYLDKLKIIDKTKVFHSFRSNFINKLTEYNVHPAIVMGIVGHYEQAKIDLSSPHFKNYQETKTLVVLKENIEQISYDIDLSIFSMAAVFEFYDEKLKGYFRL